MTGAGAMSTAADSTESGRTPQKTFVRLAKRCRGGITQALRTRARTDARCVSLWRMDAPQTNDESPRGELVIRTIAMPADTNPSGDIFGGWIMSQMDLGSGIIASQTARSRVVTVAVDGMSFLEPVRVGDTIACYARVEKIGRTSMKIPVEVWAQRYRRQERLLVTRAVFTYVAVDETGSPIPVQRE
jgi:acyl-CoA thioesterase YciA